MKKKGITLIELIIVLALNTIVLATIYNISLVGNKVMLKTEMQSELQSIAEEMQSELIYYLEAASEILMINNIVAEEIYYKDLIDYNSEKLNKISVNSLEIKYSDESIIRLNLMDKELSYMILGENKNIIQPKKTIARYVEDFSIVPSDIRQIKDIEDHNLKFSQGIKIDILLKKSKSYVNMEYPINTIITFKNK